MKINNEVEFDDGTDTITVWMRCGEKFANQFNAPTALDWCKAEIRRMIDCGSNVKLALREVPGSNDIICAIEPEGKP